MQNRDFKGVWIPKEIWLNPNLTMLEKVVFTEINSLDNENHCTASNKYLAEFCGCSESAISKAISKLKKFGLIEELEFNGRMRTMQTGKIYYADCENLLPINTVDNSSSNTININTNKSVDNKNKIKDKDFIGSAKKERKLSLYDKCSALIQDFVLKEYGIGVNGRLYSDTDVLTTILHKYLKMILEMKKESGENFYSNNFKGKLNELKKFPMSDWIDIVNQSIEKGWKSFYSLKNNSIDGIKSNTRSNDYWDKQKEWQEEMVKNGKQIEF